MSDCRELTQNYLAEYEQMTAEELAAVLRGDLAAENDSGLDNETLLHVMKLYARKQPNKPLKTAEEAYAEFRRDYMSRGKNTALWKKATAASDESEMHRRKTKRWRFMTTAAAVVALVLCAGLCVRAGVPKWDQPIYRQNRDYLVVSGAYGEVTECNISEFAQQCFPRWLPEEYDCVQIQYSDEDYTAVYYQGELSDEECLTVAFQTLDSGRKLQFLKNPEPAKEFAHNGICFYQYTNAQWNCAVGYFDGVLFSLSAKVSDEEIIQIVQSMPVGK